jgi:23S rRNA (guanosine2251-2'-O)-methyltransferase
VATTGKLTDAVPGFHAIREALVQGRVPIGEIWIAEGKRSGRSREILGLARAQSIPVRAVGTPELEKRFPGLAHQGMVAITASFSYSSPDDILQGAGEAAGRGLILVADHITDEGNLGALIRTGAFFGAHGLVLPRDRSARVSATVVKRASGTVGTLPVCRVVNLGRALEFFDKKGFWILGASGEGTLSIYQFDWRRDVVLILGNEERGMSPSVEKHCHEVVRIPRVGPVESLNISVAAGVILAEIRRQQVG